MPEIRLETFSLNSLIKRNSTHLRYKIKGTHHIHPIYTKYTALRIDYITVPYATCINKFGHWVRSNVHTKISGELGETYDTKS